MAVVSSGITLTRASVSNTVFEIIDVTPPGITRESIKTTSQGDEGAHSFEASELADGGEMELNVQFDPSHTNVLFTGGVEVWQLTFTNDSNKIVKFSGFVKGYKPTGALDTLMTASLTIKVTGILSNS